MDFTKGQYPSYLKRARHMNTVNNQQKAMWDEKQMGKMDEKKIWGGVGVKFFFPHQSSTTFVKKEANGRNKWVGMSPFILPPLPPWMPVESRLPLYTVSAFWCCYKSVPLLITCATDGRMRGALKRYIRYHTSILSILPLFSDVFKWATGVQWWKQPAGGALDLKGKHSGLHVIRWGD